MSRSSELPEAAAGALEHARDSMTTPFLGEEKIARPQDAELFDVELACGHHVTLIAYPQVSSDECPWCPEREQRAIVAVDGRPVTDSGLISEARAWIEDAFSDVSESALSDAEVRRGVERHCDVDD